MASRFVREIPEELLDRKLPGRRFSDEQIVDAMAEAVMQRAVYDYRSQVEAQRPVYDNRPKAVLKPKETSPAVKPYISQSISDLNRVAGISKGISMAGGGLDYGVGDKVKHIKFGEGTVLNIVQEPRDYKVTVNFEEYGQKVMFASFAKLKRI